MHSGMVHRFILTQTTHRYSYAFRNGSQIYINPDNTDILMHSGMVHRYIIPRQHIDILMHSGMVHRFILTQTTHRYSYAFRNGSQIYINPDNT